MDSKRWNSQIYFCAGEIYAKIGDEAMARKYYVRSRYFDSFLRSEFGGQDYVELYSFRRYNEHTLSDLINGTITVCPSTYMNDPFDSIVNPWRERLMSQKERKSHIRPMCESFNYYRIRSFCMGEDDKPLKNILMWSHYAGEHTGFCIKYKLSKHFIKQMENDDTNEHMYLQWIKYKNTKVDVSVPSIDTDLAFVTKKSDWKYEKEVRLIVYNPNKEEPFYGVEMDQDSGIEAIIFGCKCPENTINTVRNIFLGEENIPEFYKMVMDEKDVYNLKVRRLDSRFDGLDNNEFIENDQYSEIKEKISEIGELWRDSACNPRNCIEDSVLEEWDKVINEWVEDGDIPLIVRKGNLRGQTFMHESGRKVIVSDNTVAQWVYYHVLNNKTFSLSKIKEMLNNNEIPLVYIKSRKDVPSNIRSIGKYALSKGKSEWKLCHIEPVGLNTRDEIEKIDLEELKSQFRKYINPRNMFVLPKELGGIGEVRSFIDAQI